MRFSATHRVATHLTVLFAHLSLLLSGELSPWVSLVSLVCLGVSWFWEPKRPEERTPKIAAALGALAVLYAIIELARSASASESENLLLLPFAHFLLLFQSTRLFARRQSRDYLQIYVISFFELITATALNEDLSYALCFLCYSISITWALILFHLRREMEDNYLLRHSDDLQSEKVEVERILNSKRIVSSSFLLITGGLMLVTVISGSFISLFFPRASGGPPVAKWRRQHLVGFSDGIALGQFGRLRENFRVAMRVKIQGETSPRKSPLYFRGLAFDTYDGRSWSRSDSNPVLLPKEGERFLVTGPSSSPASTVEIFLEPIEPPVLFVPGETRTVRLLGGGEFGLARDSLENLIYGMSRRGVVHYEVTTILEESSGEAVKERQGEKIPPEIAARYLSLPVLEDGVARLARQITREADSFYEKARLIESYLKQEYTYSLELKRDPSRAPLEDFLFVQKQGHCEYFATAMAILLRTQGVPTRVVNGFYGGEWNEYGEFYAIRQGDAHSWVEVYLPGAGWMRFDPTPTRPLVREGWLGSLERFYDAIRLRWFTYVVDYDLFVQQDLFSSAKELIQSSGEALGLILLVACLGGALVIVGLLVLRAWRRRRKSQVLGERFSPVEERPRETGDRKRLLKLYRRALEVMARRGISKPSSATAREFLELLAQKGMPCPPVLVELTMLYEAVRFGDTPTADIPWEELQNRVKELEREAF